MTRTRASRGLFRRSAALAGALTLGVTGTALADITGTVRTPGGSPVAGISVTAREPDGSFAASATTNGAGQYVIPTSQLTGDTPPFTLSAESSLCRVFPETEATATGTAPGDGAVVDLTLDARLFCATSSFGAPEATAHAWPQRGLILAPPGGTLALQVQAGSASGGGGYSLTLQDGTVVGTGTSRFSLPLTAPGTPYNGPLNLVYTDSSGPQTAQIATLQVGRPPVNQRPASNLDLLAIVDVSGSMSGNDPGFRRKTAVQLLIDLSSAGDRLAAVGFDDSAKPIFARTTITGNAVKNRLKGLANRRIVNAGGTDYNDGFVPGFDALTADPLDPQRPKAVIFLTDGAHNSGAYENAHLRFAFNGTGFSWPVCVVQLGRSFDADDVARLRRIAADTGGIFVRSPTNAELENLYFRCFGRSSGERTLGRPVVRVFRVGQVRAIPRRIPRGQRRATFFVSFQQGRYRLVLRQPGGKVYTRSVGKRVRLVKGRTFAFFRVLQPRAGRWTLRVQRLPSGGRLDRATTTVSVLPRR